MLFCFSLSCVSLPLPPGPRTGKIAILLLSPSWVFSNGKAWAAVEHASAFDMATAWPLPSTLINLGPQEQNNSVAGRFEKRPGGNEPLRAVLMMHWEQLGGRRELGRRQPGRAGMRLAFCTGLGYARQPCQVQSLEDKAPHVFQRRDQKIQVKSESLPDPKSHRVKIREEVCLRRIDWEAVIYPWLLSAQGLLFPCAHQEQPLLPGLRGRDFRAITFTVLPTNPIIVQCS